LRRITGKSKREVALSASLAALLIYTVGVSLKGRITGSEHPVEHMISMDESKATKYISSEKAALVKHNMTHLTRIWPKLNSIAKIASANFLPHSLWAGGCQLVAMNWQTPDLGMQLNQAMFTRNGACGYVLKPEALRIKDQCKDSQDRLRFAVEVTVISAQQLPRFNDVSRDQEKESDVIDPHVALSIQTPDHWGQQPPSVDTGRNFFGGSSPLGIPVGANVNGFEFDSPRRSSTSRSFAQSALTNSQLAPAPSFFESRRPRRSDSVSSVSSATGGTSGNRTARLKTTTIKGNGFNPIWNQKLCIQLEIPAGDSTLARASDYMADEASGRPDNLRALSRGLLDLCFIKFEVCEDNQLDYSCLATNSVCLGSMLQGYRHVPLFDAYLTQYRFASLFIHYNIKYVESVTGPRSK